MSCQSVDARALGTFAEQRAVELLRGGMPLSFTVRAARAFVERCQAVLAELDGADSLLALKLLTAHTIASVNIDLPSALQPERLARVMGERLGGDLAEAYANLAWGFTHPAPEHAKARVSAANQVLDTASSHDEELLVLPAYALLLAGLLEQGEIRTLDSRLLDSRLTSQHLPADGRLDDLHSLEDHVGSSDIAGRGRGSADPATWFHILRSLLDGDTQTAERQVEELYAETKPGNTKALALYTTQLGLIRWMQGRIHAAEESFLAARRAYPVQLLWEVSLAWLWLLQGRTSAADALLQSLPAPGDLPRDRYWLSTVVVFGEIALLTGSRKHAERVRDLLLPHADHLVVVGAGVAFWGTAARPLGRLEEQLGNLRTARKYLELAVTMSGRIGALAWYAEAQIELAEFAIRHEILDIPSHALLTEARATSEARGFHGLALRAKHRPRVRVLGTFEVVSFCGMRTEWNSRKARELLKMLVAARGNSRSREVYMEILWPGESPSTLGNRFSVAVNVIRRALDPQRLLPTQHHVVTEGDSIRLDLAHLDIDLEQFLTLSMRTDEKSREAALTMYRGDAFSDALYADWAVQVREHAKHRRNLLDAPAPEEELVTE